MSRPCNGPSPVHDLESHDRGRCGGRPPRASVSPIGLVVAFGLAYVALIGVTWWMFHGFRRLSALCLRGRGRLAAFCAAGLCIYRLNMGGVMLMLLVWLLAFPLVFGAGAAWATAATRRAARPRRSRSWLGRWSSRWASCRSRCSSPVGRFTSPSSLPRRLWIAWRIASLPVRGSPARNGPACSAWSARPSIPPVAMSA